MHIVTDAGADLAPEQAAGITFHSVPLTFRLDGISYQSGVDITPPEFYDLLSKTQSFPETSQPSPGEFATLYRSLAETGDREILSIHISSGLSGTLNSARLGAQQAPEANVTFFDSLTLSAAQGWMVEAGARAAAAGWHMERIVEALEEIRRYTETHYTLATLKYLEHGGRISHLQALLGQILDLKPIIGVEKERGTYVVHGRERSLKRAIDKVCETALRESGASGPMRVQVMHGRNPEGAAQARAYLERQARCTFLPLSSIAPVLGAHTGPGLVGVASAPAHVFAGLPGMG